MKFFCHPWPITHYFEIKIKYLKRHHSKLVVNLIDVNTLYQLKNDESSQIKRKKNRIKVFNKFLIIIIIITMILK